MANTKKKTTPVAAKKDNTVEIPVVAAMTKAEPKKEEINAEPKANMDLSKMTVAELREAAKDKDIKGYSTMKKAELIDALK